MTTGFVKREKTEWKAIKLLLTKEHLERFQEIADEIGMTKSALARVAILNMLNEMARDKVVTPHDMIAAYAPLRYRKPTRSVSRKVRTSKS